MLSVKLLQPHDEAHWDQFVDSQEHGTIFHKIAWKRIIASTFDYRPCYLFAEEDGKICGVLPLFHARSIFAGNALISSPFAVYGGILAVDENAEFALFESCKMYARQFGVSYIELRQRFRCHNAELQTRDSLYCTFVKPIYPSPEQCLSALPKEARRMVRKGQKLGLTSRLVTDSIDDFYEIYAASVRHLGTPVFPRRLFENCLQELKNDVDLLLIYHENQPVAGVLSFYYRQTVLPYYGGSLPKKNALAPNNFMHWTLMHHAGSRGYTCFDAGRSKRDTGVFDFKRHMGYEPIALPYQYYLINGAALPNNNPMNPKFRLAIEAWRHLPLALTKMLGPKLVKAFP
jgi:FemAB-related protein (PEP-CTERM system-associated)